MPIRWENNVLGFVPNEDWLNVGFSVTRPNDPIDTLFGDEKTDNLCHRDKKIQRIEDLCGILDVRHKFRDGRPGALHLHQVHVVSAHHREDGHDQYEHTHASDPVSEGAPEQAGVGESLDIGEDGGAGRREPGNCLKDRVNVGRDFAQGGERNGTKKGHDDPAQRNRNGAVPGEETARLRTEMQNHPTDGHVQNSKAQIQQCGPRLVVEKPC